MHNWGFGTTRGLKTTKGSADLNGAGDRNWSWGSQGFVRNLLVPRVHNGAMDCKGDHNNAWESKWGRGTTRGTRDNNGPMTTRGLGDPKDGWGPQKGRGHLVGSVDPNGNGNHNGTQGP